MAGVRALLEQALTQYDGLKTYLDHIRAEFVSEDARLGTGTITDAEIEAFNVRMDRMRDEQVLITFIGLLDALHVRTSGRVNDLVTMTKCAFLTMSARSLDGFPAGAHSMRWNLMFDEVSGDFDSSYLDQADA